MNAAVPRLEAASGEPKLARGVPVQMSARAAGIIIVALIPALFWTAVVAGLGAVFDVAFTTGNLAMIGSSIAAFLGVACAPIMSRTN
ncbi:MAG: hypothetical protein K2X41_01255 [Hyphomicrobium sp.]|nr:hypothetical protein [Hyphomicrobium sp.]